MPPACSVVIPTFNAAATLGDQLAALAAQDVDRPFEVIVSDNGSLDESAGTARAWTHSLDLRVIDASSRRGPSAARNIGASHARSERLLFCDADDVVSSGWVRSLTKALDLGHFVGGPYLPYAVKRGIWLPNYETDGLPTTWLDRAYAFGGNLGVTRELWNQLGGFDETLFGAEEVEFAWRAHEAGVVPRFVPEAAVHYRVRASLRGRLWHEYNSGRGTTLLASRVMPDAVARRSWKSQTRHNLMLASRFPRSTKGAAWAAWAATLAYEAGARSGRQGAHQ